MTTYRKQLPQLGQQLFLTDGGLETTLIFEQGYDLPCFASFVLIETEAGQQALRDYYERYARIALHRHCGFILEAPTWRANPDWGAELGYDAAALERVNRQCVALLENLREEYTHPLCPIVISGCLGPRGDGYVPGQQMSVEQAADYHAPQVASLASTAADMLSAMTLSYPEEAIGITRAAQAHGMPVAISFTTETDGRLPNGISLGEAIEFVDAATNGGPDYYMINCAHPDHFDQALDGDWVQRIRGIRANASRRSHAELDEAEELDSGDPTEFGSLHGELAARFPHLSVLGGCCGTDHRHVEAVAGKCHHKEHAA